MPPNEMTKATRRKTRMTDLCFPLGDHVVNLRVGAMLRRRGRLLLCRLSDEVWFLPGGRIKSGEASEEAVRRELREEVGDDFTLGPLVLCVENFYRHDRRAFHEICFFYEATWHGPEAFVSPSPTPTTAPGPETFHWVDVDRDPFPPVRPSCIRPWLARPASAFRHLVHRDP